MEHVEAIAVIFYRTLIDKRVDKNDASRDILIQTIEGNTNNNLFRYIRYFGLCSKCKN